MNSEASPPEEEESALSWLLPVALAIIIALAFGLRAFDLSAQRRPAAEPTQPPPRSYEIADFNFGRGYLGDSWQVYFNQPDGSAQRADYHGGIDQALVAALDAARDTIDIAAFELNSDPIADALLEAHHRGVALRIVTDDEHGLADADDPQLPELRAAGIPLVDDARSGLMHNKFVILDGQTVWTGSWNFTVNGAYRNNNNVLVMQSAPIAAAYQAEFDEMFLRGEFGTRSSDDGIIHVDFAGGQAQILFAAEGDEITTLSAEIARAEQSIRFMTFVFSLEELAAAMLERMDTHDVTLKGVFEDRNSTAAWSQLPALHCAGADLRQDGNRYVMHHKVIIIDDDTVITGSFNFSNNAARSNDENIVIIRHPTIAALYLEEWRQIWDSAKALPPDEVVCA